MRPQPCVKVAEATSAFWILARTPECRDGRKAVSRKCRWHYAQIQSLPGAYELRPAPVVEASPVPVWGLMLMLHFQ